MQDKPTWPLPPAPFNPGGPVQMLCPEPEAVRPSDLELMKFYGVNSLHGLIDRMEEQIKHLQEARNLRDEQPRRVRLG